MCDCNTCNMTKEQSEQYDLEYLILEYNEYCQIVKNPLTIEEWVKINNEK